ncbi:hypothetical protein ACI39X_27800, partial [Klebsiella pneumoniae]|uniref:hypothetical protein n=1 Tax=Klebsiella pneumoniae TaxID=573 RepID=UPI003853D417
MASIGMEMLAGWGAPAVTERLADITRRISAAAQDLGYGVLPESLRAPNILSLAPPHASAKDLAAALARENIFVVPRVG